VVKCDKVGEYIPIHYSGGSLAEARKNQMDLNTLTLILAIVTIIPTVGGLILQSIKDKHAAEIEEKRAAAQAEIDKTNATTTASSISTANSASFIVTLQGEVDRLNKRVMELEVAVMDKTTRIGELMMAKIDSDAATATMKYKLDTMQLKLNSILPENIAQGAKEDAVPPKLKQELVSLELKKSKIAQETTLEIEKLKNNSISNNIGE
jgi:uncharacterized coiled-coil protein SlyX